MEEGVGFEPTEALLGLTRLATWRDKPLCHPSVWRSALVSIQRAVRPPTAFEAVPGPAEFTLRFIA